jgi:hypothetical protein
VRYIYLINRTNHHERVIRMTASTMTTKDFAAALSTDPRTVRKYLRSVTPKSEQPGKGSRWELPGTKTAIAKHRKQFTKWTEDEAKRNADRLAKAAKDAADKVTEIEDAGDEEVDEDLEPTAEDLELAEEDSDQD